MVTLLGLAAAASFQTVAQGPNVSCVSQAQSPVVIRNEGKTEQIANYQFQCTNRGTSAATATIVASVSPNTVTSRVITAGSGQTEATLQIFDTSGQHATVYVHGTVSGSTVTFSNVTIPVSGDNSNYEPFDMTMVNIRVDATGNSPGDFINQTVSVSGSGISTFNSPSAEMAEVQSGLAAQTVSGVTNFPAGNGITAASPGFTLHLGENANSPTAFKLQGGTGNTGLSAWYAQNTETGYYVTGTSTNNIASAGTRVRILFSGIPTNLTIYVPLTVTSDQGSNGQLRLTSTEAGAFSAVGASSNPTGYTGTASLAQLNVISGSAEAVYEVVADNSNVSESYTTPVYLASTGNVPAANAITAAISLAPVGAASNIPNFAQLSDTTTEYGSAILGIATTSVPAAIQNLAYSTTLAAAGGTSPYFWVVTSGTLPGTIALNSSTGVLSGNPGSAATAIYPFTVRVQDNTGATATQSYNLTLDAPVSINNSSPLTAGAVGESYSVTLSAQGGYGGPYFFQVTGGALPNGLTISSGSSYTLLGTPTVANTFNFTLQAYDQGSGTSTTKAFSLTINPALAVTTTSFPVGVQGTSYPAAGATAQFSGGVGGVTWSLASGSLTGTGLSFSSSGVLSGTPLSAGSIGPITIKVTDSGTSATSSPITITVNGPLTLTTTAITPAGLQNQAMTPFQLTASGGSGVNTWGIINSGSLPSGVSISSSGVVSGTPTQSGNFTFYPRVTDNYGDSVNNGPSTAAVTWTVNPALAITQTSLPAGTLQQAYSQTFTATGGSGNSANYSWSYSGTLPAGITFSSAGVLSGTPTAGGSFSGITLTVTDSSVSQTASLSNQTLTINYPTLTITTSQTLPAGTDNAPYTTTLAASGGSLNSANLTWSINATNLPPGLTGSSAGVISGTPLAGGTFTGISVSVHDYVSNQTANQTFSLTVGYTPITFNYVSENDGLAPLGYFRLEATSGVSEVNGYTYTAAGGVNAIAGAPIGVGGNMALNLDGITGSIATSLSGGITTAATMVAWVNLSQLPSAVGHLCYIAGESQGGNDFDLQFSADNYLRFYTTNNGANLSYAPNPATLVGGWHMIAATFANVNTTGVRNLYWDGVLVATDTVVTTPNKTAAFNIGASPTVFPGRNFPGAIDEVALWNYALSTTAVREIYASASASLPTGVNGVTYSPVSLYGAGGSGGSNFTWSATGLPPGLSISSSGIVNGVPGPSAVGSYTPVLTITDATSSQSITPTVAININAAMSVPAQNLPTMTNNIPYSDAISVTGGVPPYTFALVSAQGSSLPLGGTLNSATGVVSGTPSLNGYPPNVDVTDTFTVQVTDATGTTVTSGLIGWIVVPTLTITTTSLPTAERSVNYSYTLTETGGYGPYTWSTTQGYPLPTGLTINSATGQITGAYTGQGAYPVQFQVSDSAGNTATKLFTLNVDSPVTISTTSLPVGTTGTVYSGQFIATGGAGGNVWSLANGSSLPAGLTLSTAGVLGGTPTVAGTNLTFTVTVTDAAGGAATQLFSITIVNPLSISTTSVTSATNGTAYNQTLSATGGTTPYTWTVTSGTLVPAGLSLNSSTGAITGTPNTVGYLAFTVQVSDQNARTATQSYSLQIAPSGTVLTDFAVANGAGSIVRVSDVSSRDATVCAATSCSSYFIATDALGNIYSRNPYGIIKVTRSGAVSTVLSFSTLDSPLNGGGGNGGIALDGLGNLIFVDNVVDAVFRVGTNGAGFTQVASFPVPSPEQSQDSYVAVDSLGNYIVGDDGNGGVSIVSFTPAGVPTTILAAREGSYLTGFTIDSGGNYEYLDYVAGAIVKVTTAGAVSTLFQGPPLTTGNPAGMTIEPATGDFMVVLGGSSSVSRITVAGAVTTIPSGGLITNPRDIKPTPAILPALIITPTTLSAGVVGQAYFATLHASGGSGNYNWTASGLPSGLTLSTAGVISGSPGAAGSYTAQVTVTDLSTTQTGSITYSLSISSATPPPALLTISGSASSISTNVGGSVSATFSASGGSGVYTFSATGLPSGVSISAAGSLSGSPSQAGSFNVFVTVTDSHGDFANTGIVINVLGVTSGALPGGTAGQAYSATIAVLGATGNYSCSASGLPAGLTISQACVVSGILKTANTYSFTVTVTAGALTASGTFSVTFAVPAALTISTATLPGGTVNIPYSGSLAATGGFAPYQWSIAAGTPPAGLSLNGSGVVSGTPTIPGSFSFGVMVTDSSGGIKTAVAGITIQAAALTITTGTLPGGISGTPYPTQVFNATGGAGGYTWAVTSGTLPTGFTLSSGGTLSNTGLAGAAGSFPFTVTVTDSAKTTATASYTLAIGPPSLDLILSSGSLNFSLSYPATTLPASQTIGVQSDQAGQQLTYSAAVNPAAPWMILSNGSSTPDTMQVSLTSAAMALTAGVYQTTITATCTSSTCPLGSSQTASVTLTVVNAPPALQVTTDLLAFGLSTASGSVTQSITIKNAGGGTIGIASIGCEAVSYCTAGAAPQSLAGGVSASVPITINPAAAGLGFQRTQIDIVTSAGKGSVPVTVLVANAATMALAPVGQQFTLQAGGAPGNANGSFLVPVTNGNSANWTAAVTSPTDWLLLGTTSGSSTPTQPGTVNYSIGPTAANLAPGSYYGSILVTSSNVVNSPLEFEVVLSVTAATTTLAPDPEPGGLLYITTAAVTPPAQTVEVYAGSTKSLTFQASATGSSGGINWLSVSPTIGSTSSSTPGVAAVSVKPAGLAPGIYTGGVSFSLSAAAVRTVNVTLVVTATPGSETISGLQPASSSPRASGCTGTTLVPAPTGLVSNFSAAVAWPTPLTVVLADNCGNLLTNGQIVATFSNGDPPLPLNLANPATASYSGTWTPRSASAQMTIVARASAPNYPNATTQIAGATTPNAAPVLTPHGTLHSFDPIVGAALAPGTIVQIYGQNLAGSTLQPSTIPLPTTANGTTVLIGGIPAPLYYVSPGQINAQVPFELNGNQPYQVVVSANGALATPDTLNLTAAAPGLASFADSTLIAQHGDGSLVSATSPAKSGEYLVAYLAGMGDTNATPASGAASPLSPLALPTLTPTLTINGAPSPIAFAGLTPGLVGLYQMNFQVPAGLPAGDITLVVTQNGAQSNHTVLPYTP